jgi:hypothetical protein
MNDKVMKKLGCLALLFVATLFAQNASATLEPMLESSYHDGFVFYYEDNLRGRIDFAVYDTDPEPESEYFEHKDEYLDNGLEKPGEGRYIYAYQIFNDYPISEEAVAYFALLDINGDSIDIDSIGSQEDPEAGIEPGEEYFSGEESRVVWEFNGGDGYIIAGEHSWFLVFSSEQDWTEGDYEIRGPAEVPIPVPEPATIALLGLGSIAVLMRRRRTA